MKEILDLLKHNECQHEYQMNGEDHRDALKKIDKENEFFSVILIQEPLDESMMENPKYIRKIPITHTSRIEQEARSLMDVDYHGNYDWINKEIEKHYSEIEGKDKYKEFDYYIKCLMDSYFPKALEECLWEWAMFQRNGDPDTEFEEEQYQEVIDKHKEEYEKYKKDVFLPQYLKVKPIKTFVTAVDSKCNFEIEKKSENLILLRHDLTGNYKIDREESEKILEGIDMY